MKSESTWRPSASIDVLRRRAAMLERARQYFSARNVLEVTTPALNATTVTDVNISSIRCRLSSHPEREYYLHTSPEYRMKQLVAAYGQDIYQICPVYRDNELGNSHHTEFTLVEWYRQGHTLDQMIAETAEFLLSLAGSPGPDGPTLERLTYTELFMRTTGVDPRTCSIEKLTNVAQGISDLGPSLTSALGDDRASWLDYLFSHAIAPELRRHGGLVAVTHYPAVHAALARLDASDPRIAERFEIFWGGLELANGYRELTDATEQRERFAADQALRNAKALPKVDVDENLLAALEAGLPDCCGVAVGFDRLLMRAARLESLADAVSFTLT